MYNYRIRKENEKEGFFEEKLTLIYTFVHEKEKPRSAYKSAGFFYKIYLLSERISE